MVVDTVDDHYLTLVLRGNGSDYPMQFQPVYAFKDRTATGSSEYDVIEGEYFAHGIFFKYKEFSINSGLGYRRSATAQAPPLVAVVRGASVTHSYRSGM